MKTILVTGAAGFLGSTLCHKLLNDGHKVIGMDNFLTGKKENLASLNESFRFIEQDIIDPIILDEKIDQIYNLACPASPPLYQKDPIHTMKTSVLGALNVLEFSKKNNATVLQASTSEIYGEPELNPQVEEYRGNVNPIGPRACYDEGKRAAESLFFDYYRKHGVKIKVVRIFNTYGPNMDKNDGRVVSNFINQALRNEAITIYGEGLQTRSFCFVNDLVNGLVAMMNSGDEITGPINLGNPHEITVKTLAEKVVEKTGSKSKIIYKDLPVDDPTQRRPDITKAKNVLKWEPKVSLDEGLDKTIVYFTALV